MKRKSNKNRKIIFILAALSLLISAVYAGTYFATPFFKEKQNGQPLQCCAFAQRLAKLDPYSDGKCFGGRKAPI